ncbi:hypothetical protein HK099_003214 [Clydaea vesicula]|uniref:Protein-serine/threonine kinase n=1 Tax=Clydaea vesicula TaxID=447962 RepID=A0AAD5TUG5_9FUNG|nr:hypothetical protein HK099_003214 [Clydaea vesicula]
MANTVRRHKEKMVLPPISVVICDGVEDITIKISDEAGGFPDSYINNLWSYLDENQSNFTDVKGNTCLSFKDEFDFPPVAPSFSLPFSRQMARYFGGDLEVVSMEGHGSDTFIHLFKKDTELENISDVIGMNKLVIKHKKENSSKTLEKRDSPTLLSDSTKNYLIKNNNNTKIKNQLDDLITSPSPVSLDKPKLEIKNKATAFNNEWVLDLNLIKP